MFIKYFYSMDSFASVEIFLLLFSSFATCQEWLNPKFEDPGTVNITFEHSGSGGLQPIAMHEELKIPIKVAIINYKGLVKPSLGPFQVGNNDLLKATINKGGAEDDGKWILWINTRQDYENEAQRKYQFAITIGKESHSIIISVRNIFDVKPTITYDGPCHAKELHANYNTKCVFQVTAADGLENNEISLKIIGPNEVQSLFEFRNKIMIDAYRLEYTLFVTKELRYEERTLYSFTTYVYDIAGNNNPLATIVEIEDIPSLDPFWVKVFSSATILEKTEQQFQVKAMDGDTGINKPICYKLQFAPNNDYSNLMSVNKLNGTLQINKIDRDALDQQIFAFSFWAYKCDNETWGITGPAAIIVEDIDDHLPEFEISPRKLKFKEETYEILLLNKFIINDLDSGDHATYNVSLSQKGNVLYSTAFNVIPDTGYKKAYFKLTIANASLLDYEDPIWRSFILIIIAQETKFPENKTEIQLPIELINWNDEKPIFPDNDDLYSVSVDETIGSHEFIALVQATDRDINDAVIHEIVGNIPKIGITDGGLISTTDKDAFDYERQTTVIIQIRATDTLVTYPGEKRNNAFAQLTININDINDETPEIRMPREAPHIPENSPSGTLVTDGILATDKDTTANLTIVINWKQSYATKSGQDASKDTYENCFIIELHSVSNREVYGHLKVNPTFKKQIDYEMYEVIYLSILVTDLNQVVNNGTVTGILTVHISDVNDNPPRFTHNTLDTDRSVIEEAISNTLVGTIFAEDIDGPEFNKIKYEIIPNDTSTPNDLISIDPETGALKVSENAIIDCDDPKIFYLNFTIHITDGELSDYGRIQIRIIDINNKNPIIKKFKNPIEIYENSTTGHVVGVILAADKDRDEPHNILQYMIDYSRDPELRKFFEINIKTGLIMVKLQNEQLDRDNGIVEHNINVNIEDNFNGNGRTNHNSTTLRVILLDVNDNAPELPSPEEFSPVLSENSKEGTIIGRLIAPDRDEYNTPNSWVSYRILNIKAGIGHAENLPDTRNLFDIRGDDKIYGDLIAKKSLRGYYGTWMITIEAYDHGDEGDSRLVQKSNETYSIQVEPYNFNTPRIIYPIKGSTLRMRFERQEIGKALYMVDGSELPLFEAEDSDGGEFGNVKFEISNSNPQSNDVEYFKINKISKNTSRLEIQKNIKATSFRINVKAIDGGKKQSVEIKSLVIVFVNMKGEPEFNIREYTTNFTENEFGLEEERIIPEAYDPKNEGIENDDEMFDVFYFIDKNYNSNDAILFTLNKKTRILKLNHELDRESIDTHWIKIYTTNKKDPEENVIHNEASTILIKIIVNDVNDNPPIFDQENYGAGITTNDYDGKPLLTVHATDRDLNDSLRYILNMDSLIAVGENVDDSKFKMFEVNETTGLINLKIKPKVSMKGYFEFSIEVFDEVNHNDTCRVKIYIIAESNRVSFIFLSSETQVRNNIPFITEKFEELYGYDECNIDDVKPYQYESRSSENSDDNSTTNDLTNAVANFIQNNEAIEAIEIQKRSIDLNFISKLKNTLLEKSLILHDVPISNPDELSENMENLLTTILIVVSLVLGILCIVLVVAFILKTRTLNRQIRAFGPANFGSTESNLNRIGVPTTNVYSVQGSNPVLNNNNYKRDAFDAMSIESYESDFMGINNDETFMHDDHRDSVNPTLIKEIERNYLNKNDEIYKLHENEKY